MSVFFALSGFVLLLYLAQNSQRLPLLWLSAVSLYAVWLVLGLRDGGGGVVKIVVRRQSLQINFNQTSGQTRCMATVGHDDGNGLADIGDFMHGQHRKSGVLHEGQQGVDVG